MSFLNNRYARVLTIVLALQAAGFYAVASRREITPNPRPLSQFPIFIGDWVSVQDHRIEKEVQEILKADDTLNRTYANSARTAAASLFIAFFKTQRAGQAPHSPKNCLPGSGWEPSATGDVEVALQGASIPRIKINRYVVARGDEKSVVLYWYQSHNRVIASEFEAKFWLVADAVRYRRSDTALVRIVVPVRDRNEQAALDTALAFVRAVFPEVERQLPI